MVTSDSVMIDHETLYEMILRVHIYIYVYQYIRTVHAEKVA